MALVKVRPIGKRRSMAFVDGVRNGHDFGEFTEIETDVYPESKDAADLHALRVSNHISLRQAANALKLNVVDYCALEHGRQTYTTEDEWDAAFIFLRELIKP